MSADRFEIIVSEIFTRWMKTKFACCDLTENLAAFEARNTISSNFRFRLQDLPKIIARNQFVKPINLTRFVFESYIDE